MIRSVLASALILAACSSDPAAVDEPDAEVILGNDVDAAVQAQPDAPPVVDPQPDAGGGPVVLADLQFRPATHGFRFPNYSNRNNPQNLTPVEIRRFFGDQVCADLDGDTCTLSPPAEEWMNVRNEKMGGGHCEGFAVLSLLMFKGVVNPSSFGAATTAHDLVFAGNTALQRELAYWWAGQLLTPTVKGRTFTFTPVDVVNKLVEAFNAGSETFTIGIWKRGWEGGHAVTPYAVVNLGGGLLRIMVYDNNWPDMERYIEVDTNANTWKYLASTNPNNPASVYEGDSLTKTMFLVPTTPRLMPQTCPFCAGVAAAKPGAGAGTREIALEGDGDLLIEDAEARRLGYVGGHFVNEMPAASFQPVVSDDDLWSDDEEPLYQLPVEGPLTVTMDGSMLTAPSRSTVTVVAPGVVLGVEDVMLDVGQKDQIFISGDNTQIRYETSGTETPEVLLGVEQEAADYAFFIKSTGEAGGQTLDLDVDRAAGKLRIDVGSADGIAGYDLTVLRIDDAGAAYFVHMGNSEGAGDVVYVGYGTWSANGSPMTLEVDKGGDGTIDESYEITDQG